MNIVSRIMNEPAGGTVSLHPSIGVPSYGYLVGGAAPALTLRSSADVPVYRRMIEAYVRAVDEQGYVFVGWWTDPETGRVHLDVATWHSDVCTADRYSHRRGEIAFYDLGGKRSLKTGDSGSL